MIVRVASRVRLLTTVALMAGALAGCKTLGSLGSTETTGSISSGAPQRSESDWRREADALGERFRNNPRDADNAIRYAQALRATAQRTQAAAVLETAAIHNPANMVLLGAYGRALADAGNFKQALDVLERSHSPDQPDWRILSVQGAVLDQMGRHDEAQRYYASALKIMPDEPSVLSNLGLSYALAKDLKRAEATLRRAWPRAVSTSACGRIWRWWSGCRAASRRPKPSPARTCRRARRPQTSLTCARCWRKRAAAAPRRA